MKNLDGIKMYGVTIKIKIISILDCYYNKTNQMQKFLKHIFQNRTLHVSDSSSFHQQFFTVHKTIVYVIQVC